MSIFSFFQRIIQLFQHVGSLVTVKPFVNYRTVVGEFYAQYTAVL